MTATDSLPNASEPVASSVFRALWRLALPVLAEESLNLLVGYTDWWLAGHFLRTTDHQAAMGLAAYMTWLLPNLFAALAIGATALTARFVGAGQRSRANDVLHQALLLGIALAGALVVATWLLAERFVFAMQLEGRAAELALHYLRIVIPCLPFLMVEQVGAACLRGAGDTVSGFLVKTVVNVVNMTVSTLLLLGPGPIPALGWSGLAIGTLSGHVMGGLLMLVLLCRGRSGLRLVRAHLRLDTDLVRRLLRIGLPGGVDVLAVIGCHLVYVSIINRLGTLAAAAHGLGVQIEAMSYLPGGAFQVASTTIAGQSLGAADPRRATRGVLLTCGVAVVFLSGAALVLFFGGGVLTTFFTGNPQDPAGQLSARLLRIAAVASPFLGVLQCLTGGLRGAGDTRFPLLITFAGLIGLRLPAACLLAWDSVTLPIVDVVIPGMGWGVFGAWWAMAGDIIFRSVLVSLRFAQGGWQRIEV